MEIDIRYIERLERSINKELIHYGCQPVSFAKILRRHQARNLPTKVLAGVPSL